MYVFLFFWDFFLFRNWCEDCRCRSGWKVSNTYLHLKKSGAMHVVVAVRVGLESGALLAAACTLHGWPSIDLSDTVPGRAMSSKSRWSHSSTRFFFPNKFLTPRDEFILI